jgi:hypothetical protein
MTAVPDGPIQDTMIVLKMLLIAQSHHTQGAAYGSLSRGENGAEEEIVGVFPDATGE